jgi:hypothetical protein
MAKRMVKTTVKDRQPPRARGAKKSRKVTYSLPHGVASELDRRSAGSARGKSRLVAEALAFYFSAQDRQALAVLYAEAAEDPLFRSDNEAVLRDFVSLDREVDGPSR